MPGPCLSRKRGFIALLLPVLGVIITVWAAGSSLLTAGMEASRAKVLAEARGAALPGRIRGAAVLSETEGLYRMVRDIDCMGGAAFVLSGLETGMGERPFLASPLGDGFSMSPEERAVESRMFFDRLKAFADGSGIVTRGLGGMPLGDLYVTAYDGLGGIIVPHLGRQIKIDLFFPGIYPFSTSGPDAAETAREAWASFAAETGLDRLGNVSVLW